MSMNIDTHDFETKVNQAVNFLKGGDKVKVSVRFRGREMAHTSIGEALLRDYAKKCADIANMDKEPKLEGRSMSMVLTEKR